MSHLPGAVALHSHVHPYAESGGGSDLVHTFVHAVVSAVAWRGVGALFRDGHGFGLVILVAAVALAAVYFLRQRSSLGRSRR